MSLGTHTYLSFFSNPVVIILPFYNFSFLSAPLSLPPSVLFLTPLSSLSPLQVEDLASTQPLTFSESSLEQMIPLQISLMMTSLVVSLLPRLLLHILQNVGERLEDLITCVTVGMVLCIILWDVLYFEKTLVAAISSCSAAVKIG